MPSSGRWTTPGLPGPRRRPLFLLNFRVTGSAANDNFRVTLPPQASDTTSRRNIQPNNAHPGKIFAAPSRSRNAPACFNLAPATGVIRSAQRSRTNQSGTLCRIQQPFCKQVSPRHDQQSTHTASHQRTRQLMQPQARLPSQCSSSHSPRLRLFSARLVGLSGVRPEPPAFALL